MKYFLGLLLLPFLFSGCGILKNNPYSQNDFTPIDAGEGKKQEENDERPLNVKLETAVSSDGFNFTPTGNWISDQAHMPDLVIKDDRIFLYYSGWIVGEFLNRTAVAISQDNGKTWVYKYVTVNGAQNLRSPSNPDIILLDDGTFRLYYTSSAIDGIPYLFYAESSDGLSFDFKSAVFAPVGYQASNSTTFKIADTWHLYAQTEKDDGTLWHLTSTDGIHFEVYARTSFPMDTKNYLPSNGIWIDEKFHIFLYSKQDSSIRSMFTKNGFDWYPDDGARLSPVSPNSFVRDSSIVQLPSGEYLMVYTTNF